MKMHVYVLALISIYTANLIAMDQQDGDEEHKEEKKELIHNQEERKIEASDSEHQNRKIKKKRLRRSRSAPQLGLDGPYDPLESSSAPFPLLLNTLNSLAALEEKNKHQEKGEFFDPRKRAHHVLQHQQKNEKSIHFLQWYKKCCEISLQYLEVKKQKTEKAIQNVEGNLKTLEKEYQQAAITYQSSAAEAGKRSVYGHEEGIGAYVPSLASITSGLVSVAPALTQGAQLIKGLFYSGS